MLRWVCVGVFLIGFCLQTAAQFRKSRERSDSPTAPPNFSDLNYANPAEYYIGGIEVEGLKVLDKSAIVSLSGLKVGDKIKIPGDQVGNAVRKLWKHGLVGDVTISIDRVEGQNVFLVIDLTERPRLAEFYFTGISKGRQSSLKEDLDLIKGKIVNDAMIRNAEQTIKKHFVKKGFLNTRVRAIQVQDTLNRGYMRLRFDVDLQNKVRINEIAFTGNDAISSNRLKKTLKKTKEHPRLKIHRVILGGILHSSPREKAEFLFNRNPVSWRQAKEFLNKHVKLNIFNGSKFIAAEFEEDKQKLIAFYNARGYRDAEILSDTITRYDRRGINVHFKLSEGRKYYFRNITWTGNYLYTSATLDKVLDIKKGDVYNKELLDKKTSFNPKGADINGLYMDDGYLFFRCTPVEVGVVGDSIDVEMRIFEGDQATIDQVTISGNERTSDHVIRRELSTVPGNKFRRSDIIRTNQILSSMGYFNPQKIDQDIKPNPANGTVNIGWKVEEQSNDQIELSGGWGGMFGFVGTVGVTFNNFSSRNIPNFKKWRPLPVGDGQRLSVRMQANGRSFQSYSLSFTEPWLGGRKPNSFTVSLNHSITRGIAGPGGVAPGMGLGMGLGGMGLGRGMRGFEFTDERSLRQTGITFGMGRRLEWPDNYFVLQNNLQLLRYKYSDWAGLPPGKGEVYQFTFETVLSRNSIDNPMYPTSGSQISLSAKFTPPYSTWRDPAIYEQSIQERYRWAEFHKWMFDARYYLKLLGSSKPNGRSLVLEAKAHYGLLGSYSRDLGPGPFERFVLGGDGLAGGFNAFVLGQDIIGLRGYRNNAVTPPSYVGPRDPNALWGGIAYTKVSFELRYPVTTSQTATIYGFVFTEAGNNWDNFYQFNPFNMYRSAGTGARIFMPAFGLIGLNWAYGFDTLPGATERSGSQFHFTIGQQIR
jgi:outer membrane protein insertion porin family